MNSESTNLSGHDRAADRAATNRANAQHSTGPRTQAGKQRTRLNALRHDQPADDGFVFSKSEIETYINREERWQQANDHESSMHA